MHLKICPNPQCGKISEVSVPVCEHCGQAFPKVEAAPETATVVPAASAAQGNPPGNVAGPTDKGKPRTAALPLIMVAVVAGGLPLLWANRASLPTPKTWQGSAQDATKVEGAAPAPIGKMKPPVVPELTSAPTSAATQAPPQAPADSAAPPSAAPSSGVDQNKQTPSAAAEATKKDPEAPPQAGDSGKKTAKKVAKTPSPKKKEPPRPCTEATAALGLCDPKRSGQ